MKHTVTVGKPIKNRDKITGYKDVIEVPSNEAFRYNSKGFVTIPEAEVKTLGKPAAKKAAPKKAAPKKAKK